MYTHISKFLIILIIIMPFISPTNLSVSWLNVSSDMLKTAWGVSGVSLVLFLWILKGYKEKSILLLKTNFYLPIIGFIVWCFITLFWIKNEFEATIMLAQYVSFALIFILVVNIFLKYELIETTLKTLTISMLFVSSIGILQYYYPNNSFIQEVFTQVSVPGSTFGSKNAASHFAVMILPISFTYLLLSIKTNKIIWNSVLVFIGLWFVINTYARQAYLAITVEFLFLILFLILDFYKNKGESFIKNCKLKINKIFAIILLIISLVFVTNISPKGWSDVEDSKFDKFSQISLKFNTNTKDLDGWSRIPGWINTLEMIKDHPLQGVGIGQWSVNYPLYYDRIEKDIIFNDNTRFARLHNEYLEILANVGIIGYFFLIWLAFLTIKKIFSVLLSPRSDNRLLVLSLSLSLIGFSVLAVFSFPIRLYLPAFLVMVFISMILVSQPNQLKYIKIYTNKFYIYFLTVVFLIVTYINYQVFHWILAEDNYHKSVVFEKSDRSEDAINYGFKALSYNYKNPKYNNIVGNNLIRAGRELESIQFFKQSINTSPFNTITLLNLALAYERVNNLDMEHNVLNFILKFDPNNVRASARLVKVLVKKNQLKNATVAYKNMKGNFEYFKGRNGFGPYYNDIAKIALLVSDYKYAKYIYNNLLEVNPTAVNYVKLAALEFHYLNNKDKGVFLYKKAIKLKPNIVRNEEIRNLIDQYESSAK